MPFLTEQHYGRAEGSSALGEEQRVWRGEGMRREIGHELKQITRKEGNTKKGNADGYDPDDDHGYITNSLIG